MPNSKVNFKTQTVAILGAGSWGLAAGICLARNGHTVKMWSHSHVGATQLSETRESSRLPGVVIPAEIFITSDLEVALNGAQAILFVVPAQKTGEVARKVAKYILAEQSVILLSKGIEKETLLRQSEVVLREIPTIKADRICALSGPSHAEEVALSVPTTVVAASSSERSTVWTQELFSSESFRVYRSSDIIGVELGGAVKNIIAIACGITQALELGDNALGALVTRGLAEMSRLGVKLGAEPLTFAGLSGIGDLVTTCFSKYSRNRTVGWRLGKGESLPEILESLGMVAEGVDTCRAVRELAERCEVETPITEQVYKILFEDKNPRDGLRDLMGRTLKHETWN